MANTHLLNSVFIPIFLPAFSLVRTAESLISDPAAGMVRTAATLRDRVRGTFLVHMSHRSHSGFAAPWAMPLAVSITDPPPTAMMISAPVSMAFFTPSSACDSRGLAFTPPKESWAMPAASREASTCPKRPDFLTRSEPYTRRALEAPAALASSPVLSAVPLPNITLVGV